jgi:hypothetical protein
MYTILFLGSVLRLLVTAYSVPSSSILVTLTMKAIRSSETSVLTRSIRRNILEDGILHDIRWCTVESECTQAHSSGALRFIRLPHCHTT